MANCIHTAALVRCFVAGLPLVRQLCYSPNLRESIRFVLKPVVTHPIEGTLLRRDRLDSAVARMFRNARRIGMKLERWLTEHPDDDMGGVVMWMADYEQRMVYAGLREQRERAKLTAETGALTMDDATFERELKKLARKTLLEMPQVELDALLKERAIDAEDK